MGGKTCRSLSGHKIQLPLDGDSMLLNNPPGTTSTQVKESLSKAGPAPLNTHSADVAATKAPSWQLSVIGQSEPWAGTSFSASMDVGSLTSEPFPGVMLQPEQLLALVYEQTAR